MDHKSVIGFYALKSRQLNMSNCLKHAGQLKNIFYAKLLEHTNVEQMIDGGQFASTKLIPGYTKCFSLNFDGQLVFLVKLVTKFGFCSPKIAGVHDERWMLTKC
jgi:hypothetical protein